MIRLPRWLRITLLLLFLIALSTEPATTQTAITTQLLPFGGSAVQGTAILTASGNGTSIKLQVVGLGEGTNAQATLHGGNCTQPGASAAPLPALVADPSGRVSASGSILFQGTEQVALTAIADGEHGIAITNANGVQACGIIPSLSTAQGAQLPATGVVVPSLLTVVTLGIALLAVGGGLWLKVRHI